MIATPLRIPEVVLLEPKVFGDVWWCLVMNEDSFLKATTRERLSRY
jgi:hypothetical protein